MYLTRSARDNGCRGLHARRAIWSLSMLGATRDGDEGDLGGGGVAAVARCLDGCLSGHRTRIIRESSAIGLVTMIGSIV